MKFRHSVSFILCAVLAFCCMLGLNSHASQAIDSNIIGAANPNSIPENFPQRSLKGKEYIAAQLKNPIA